MISEKNLESLNYKLLIEEIKAKENLVHWYDILNKCVLSLDLKISMLLLFLTFAGRVFHMHGPMDLNELLCTNSVLDLVVYSSPLCVDLRLLV